MPNVSSEWINELRTQIKNANYTRSLDQRMRQIKYSKQLSKEYEEKEMARTYRSPDKYQKKSPGLQTYPDDMPEVKQRLSLPNTIYRNDNYYCG